MSDKRAASVDRLNAEQTMRWALRCQQHAAEDPSQTPEWWAAELGLCGENLDLVCAALRELPAVPSAASPAAPPAVPAGGAGLSSPLPAPPRPADVRHWLGKETR